jgi:hypothetical protein
VPRCGTLSLLPYNSRALQWGFSRYRCWVKTKFLGSGCVVVVADCQPPLLEELSLPGTPIGLLRWRTRRREATGRRKWMSTRLLRCRTRWRPWERRVCIAAAASEARIAAAAPRSLREAAGGEKGRQRCCCVAARGGARGSAKRVFVRRLRGEDWMRRRRGCYVCARGGARGSAKRGSGGALQRVARLQQLVLLRGAASVP